MRREGMTREQAIAEIGIDAVARLERINCEPTNRVGHNGNCQGDDDVEYSAEITLEDGRTATAYCYVAADDHDDEDIDIDWDIYSYIVE